MTHFCMQLEIERADASDMDPSRTNHILQDIITSWNQLRVLDIPSTFLTTASLAHVAQLLNLEAITAGLSDDIDFSCLNTPIFPLLRYLSVICTSVLTCQALLASSPLWAIRQITVKTRGGHVDNERIIKSFFTFLESRLSKKDLLGISIYNSDFPNALNNHCLDIATLGPLFSFPYLTGLRIGTVHPFDLGNEDLQAIAKSWPRLEDLTLGSRGWGAPSKITPSGLLPLLKRCRRLSWLAIAIDASVIDFQLDATTLIKPNTHVDHLFLQDSRLEDPQMMAAFLSDVMPNVKCISAWHPSRMRGLEHVTAAEAEAFEKRWKETDISTKVYVQVRKQERLRAEMP
ncbi:hypothetical protein HWV62_12703 [Athelia sp. TMB]|nr:hypothetical protein HWV62_20204 [Athelia sp. TMB]KAF7986917.1 hypothetical protein HWV62_12703 [Athelia sp. TMB]